MRKEYIANTRINRLAFTLYHNYGLRGMLNYGASSSGRYVDAFVGRLIVKAIRESEDDPELVGDEFNKRYFCAREMLRAVILNSSRNCVPVEKVVERMIDQLNAYFNWCWDNRTGAPTRRELKRERRRMKYVELFIKRLHACDLVGVSDGHGGIIVDANTGTRALCNAPNVRQIGRMLRGLKHAEERNGIVTIYLSPDHNTVRVVDSTVNPDAWERLFDKSLKLDNYWQSFEYVSFEREDNRNIQYRIRELVKWNKAFDDRYRYNYGATALATKRDSDKKIRPRVEAARCARRGSSALYQED